MAFIVPIMKRVIATLLAILVLPFAASGQATQGAPAMELTVVSGLTPPYYGSDLPGFGHYAVIVRTAFERSGYQVTFHEENWSRVFQDTAATRYDVAANVWFSQERLTRFRFSRPYARNRVMFVKHRDNPVTYADLESAKQYRLAAVRGSIIARSFPFQAFYVNDDVAVARMILRKRVDLGALEEITAPILLKEHFPDAYDRFTFLIEPAEVNESHIMISRAHPNGEALISAFNRGLDTMIADGSYARLLTEAGLEKAMLEVPQN